MLEEYEIGSKINLFEYQTLPLIPNHLKWELRDGVLTSSGWLDFYVCVDALQLTLDL